jgi:outer membrane protein TolC
MNYNRLPETSLQRLSFSLLALVTTTVFLSSLARAWTWTDAEQQAIQKNLVLKGAQDSVRISEYLVRSARSFHLPELGLIGASRYFEDQDGIAYESNLGLRMNLSVFESGRIVHRTAVSREQRIQSEYAYRLTKVQLLRDLRVAFSDAIYNKKLIDLSRKIVEQRRDNSEFVRVRYERGLEFKWVYLSSLAKLSQAKQVSLEAQFGESPALAALEVIVGDLPIQSVQEIDDADDPRSAKDYTLEEALGLIPGHPETLVKDSQIREAEAQLRLTRSAYGPSIGFQGDGGVLDTEKDPVTPFWAVGIQLVWPLFEGGRLGYDRQIARLRKSRAELESRQLALTLGSRIRRAHKDYLLAKERIALSRETYEAANDRAKVVTEQYRSGLAPFLAFERAHDDWVEAAQDVLRAERDLRNHRARLEAELGKEIGS